MTGKRKFYMFFGQLVVSAILVSTGKLAGVEFVSLQTMAIPVFIAGNFGEHYTKRISESNNKAFGKAIGEQQPISEDLPIIKG